MEIGPRVEITQRNLKAFFKNAPSNFFVTSRIQQIFGRICGTLYCIEVRNDSHTPEYIYISRSMMNQMYSQFFPKQANTDHKKFIKSVIQQVQSHAHILHRVEGLLLDFKNDSEAYKTHLKKAESLFVEIATHMQEKPFLKKALPWKDIVKIFCMLQNEGKKRALKACPEDFTEKVHAFLAEDRKHEQPLFAKYKNLEKLWPIFARFETASFLEMLISPAVSEDLGPDSQNTLLKDAADREEILQNVLPHRRIGADDLMPILYGSFKLTSNEYKTHLPKDLEPLLDFYEKILNELCNQDEDRLPPLFHTLNLFRGLSSEIPPPQA